MIANLTKWTTTAMARTRLIAHVVRFRPFDGSTPEGRSLERHRRAALTTMSLALGKAVNVFTGLISFPIGLKYLGDERFGVWAMVNSFILMISFADLGIGNGLLNAVAMAHGHDDREEAAQYVSTGFFLLLGIAMVALLICVCVAPLVNWQRVFNLTPGASASEIQSEIRRAMIVLGLCFSANIVLGIAPRVQMAYQEGFIAGLWACLASIISLVLVLTAMHWHASLPWLVFGVAGAPVMPGLIGGAIIVWQRPWLLPSWAKATRPAAHVILKLGFLFFILQLAIAIGYQSDTYVVGRVLGAAAAKEYAPPARLFMYMGAVLWLALSPLWPAYSEAIGRGDVAWVAKTLRRSMILAIATSAAGAAILVAFGKPIVHVWMRGGVNPSMPLLVGLGLWSVIYAITMALASFMNGANIVKFQVIAYGIMAIVNIALSIVLTARIGVSGVVYGSIVSQFLIVIVPSWFYVPRLLDGLKKRAPQFAAYSPDAQGTLDAVHVQAVVVPPVIPPHHASDKETS